MLRRSAEARTSERTRQGRPEAAPLPPNERSGGGYRPRTALAAAIPESAAPSMNPCHS